AISGPPTRTMRYGFVIDHRKCIGCHACTVACKEENQVPLGTFRTWVKYVEKGTWPHTRRYFSVLRCNHCDDAPCVTICPTVALYRRADGIVDFDGARCIGCKSCMQGCPYDALYIDPNTNTAAKCHYCAHRLEVGLEPACVIVCPARAIIAGDLDAPHAPRPWGGRVSAYLWTKSIAAGALLVSAIAGSAWWGTTLTVTAPAISLLFVLLTTALLVLDLKRPERFLYILFKPNWRSW